MSDVPRRAALGLGAAAVATGLGACGAGATAPGVRRRSAGPSTTTPGRSGPQEGRRLIGDGSTSETGAQPHQPRAARLRAGETPPQFVVFSWDGAGESGSQLFSHFLSVSAELHASMTFFLSGIYVLPRAKRHLYHPPRHRVGASDIPLLPDKFVHATIQQTGKAWLAGHEIGTHFNGHFCGSNGVATWSEADWLDEIAQAKGFVKQWRTNTGFRDLPALPFDYDKELGGSRTPCLEGWRNLQKAARKLGWRYDSSSTGTQVWPEKAKGLWNLPMQAIPFPGHHFDVISMDYNMMYNQSQVPNGPASMRPKWRAQAIGSWMAGFKRAYTTNRAPLVIGNHFEQWNGGIYMEAVEEVMRRVARHQDVRLVSFRQLVNWLEVQDPAVLHRLQSLQVGQSPKGGWTEFLQSARKGARQPRV